MSCNSKKINRIKIGRILGMLRKKKYKIFTKPYMLNIIGVRNAETNPTHFDDVMYVIWKNDKNIWKGVEYVITTDPSTIYLKRGGYKEGSGTAILPQGQYIDKWSIRKHAGKYLALGQGGGSAEKICVYRDYNRDNILDLDTKKTCGNYGINIHRAKHGDADDGKGNTSKIGYYSAGCQVFQNYYCFDEFLKMAERQRELYGNKFSYTLFDKDFEKKIKRKRFFITTAVLGAVGTIGYVIYKYSKK
tara:strand:+ start:514 stop:1251 length:738 start_codon:yes stop_codon:yes gene_type:complete